MTTAPFTKVAVVSGGSSGIGLACVRQLRVAGWDVAFFSPNANSTRAAELAVHEEIPTGGRLLAGAADLRDHASVRNFFLRVHSELGAISGLVCNAGYSPKGPNGRTAISDIPLDEWDEVIKVNQTGTFLCCQLSLPDMVTMGNGRIVVIGSVAGRTVPRIAGASYVASKSALVGLARSIVSEYSHQGVTVNTVCPGRVLTEMTGAPDAPANLSALERIPIGRLGRPADIARVVDFLMREDSDFINGAIIDVNGGEVRSRMNVQYHHPD
ncbi:3-oxoacyl-ACP reductase FabG [Mesorhizobium sp. M1348]|uniref:SDR family NAD(P)-dependent oxidoreductase n=1 Tax=Mesorhizobium sp. M1348 TaxID=2957089 RepID=UPI003335DA1B